MKENIIFATLFSVIIIIAQILYRIYFLDLPFYFNKSDVNNFIQQILTLYATAIIFALINKKLK